MDQYKAELRRIRALVLPVMIVESSLGSGLRLSIILRIFAPDSLENVKRKFHYYRLLWFKHDLPAGVSVFFVALPLCLGIALASGTPVYSGLLSGMIGGVVVSLISGSALSISGPAAGLTTLVSATLVSFGDFHLFLLAVVVAGMFQILLGVLKLGVIANYFPSSVIKGMLAAIGIMLIFKQIPVAIGYDQPAYWTSGFLKIFSVGHFMGNFQNFAHHSSPGAIIIALVSLAILIYFNRTPNRTLKMAPAPLVAVVAAAGLNLLWTAMQSPLALSPAQLVHIPDNVFASFSFPDFDMLFSNSTIWSSGLLIGLMATLETLLCVEAIDKLDKHNRITPINREMVAQGIGNICCGMLGAIPLTAVVVRGAANVDAGGRSQLSAITHGLLLLVTVALVPFVFNFIPFACLAAILVVTGYNLAKPRLFRHTWSLGGKQFLPFALTIAVILATDLLIGVSIGLLLSVYFIIQNNFKAEYKLSKTRVGGIDTYLIKLNSNVTFLNKVNLRKTLDKIPAYSSLVIDGSDCNFIDYDILEIISAFGSKAHDRHIELHLQGIQAVNVDSIH
jgi:MFS superfamily sulfate permease-like transporter